MIKQFADAAEFVRESGALLQADPARTTVLLTAAHGLIMAPDPAKKPSMVTVFDDGVPVAAAIQLLSYPVTLVIDPAARRRDVVIAELSRAVADHVARVTWFAGPRADCSEVAGGWAELTGANLRPFMDMLLHRLGEFRPATGVTGTSRAADPERLDDLELLAQWRHDFSVVINDPEPAPVDHGAVLRSFRAGATMMLWLDEAGLPVSFAAHSPVVGGMSRIGPVYTPAEHERHGYGSAVTTATVRSARHQGASTVVLFTDLANPTSNGIYRRLGFQPVEEFLEVTVHQP